MARPPKQSPNKVVEAIAHYDASRKNIPTAEYQPVVADDVNSPVRVAIARRNRDLDPQLVWRGKEAQDAADLVVQAPPLYIQEKVHPKALIDDLLRQSREREHADGDRMADLFADFNGIPHGADKTEFYQHDQHWTNRMILGDSLQVMASLAEREGLRGKVQCIYFDPPYGIKFNSNFQWSTTSRDVKDGKADHITREPEQVKAFRDTWRDGIHSYLTYLRDRITVARDLLADTGSIFVQIGDENIHRVRAIMDEVFGDDNFISQISYTTTGGLASGTLSRAGDYVLWYAKAYQSMKYRDLVQPKLSPDEDAKSKYDQFEFANGTRTSYSTAKAINEDSSGAAVGKLFRIDNIISQGSSESTVRVFEFQNTSFDCGNNSHWKTNPETGMPRLAKANRIVASARGKLGYIRYFDDFKIQRLSNLWADIGGSVQSRSDPKVYVVQTGTALVQRCLLMASDPGDLVLDPTCGSGTTATVAEQWGRRWITIDTSRVALALARARIMGARYPFYLLADSRDGQLKEAEVTRTAQSSQPVQGNIRHGFVYSRVPHITLKSIANNAEIDVIWERWQHSLEPLRQKLNTALHKTWEEWEIPREASVAWSAAAKELHAKWWEARIGRQREIDASIAAKAEFEYLYDKPYEDKKKVRVAGPFTVESVSPVRTLGVGADDELIDPADALARGTDDRASFTQMVLENLRTAGVQQARKSDKIDFASVVAWPGQLICAEGRYVEGDEETGTERRAAICVGPEFGTVSRADLVAAAREAADAGFDVLVACAFAYEAHTTEFTSLGKLPVLKARMNADLHMADDLKNTGKGNLFVIFGEPDIDLSKQTDGRYTVRVRGVDVFNPATGKVKSDGPEGIACWFLDTDYNEESFFVRHAYFLGANDPYSALKTTLKAEIDREAWESLNSDISRPFERPKSGRIAVKVINHLGDEVMKVFKVD
jgi:adenine-specific DNA-methyltransferase